jgi:hypothetical protein
VISYNVGKDDLSCFGAAEGHEWVVYDYEYGDYDGSGWAVSFSDGKYYLHNLGHCSCYGPFDESGEEVKLDDIISDDLHTTQSLPSSLVQKVRELASLRS